MLILTRKLNEEIKIGKGITLKIISISDNFVKIGIDAPQDVQIMRSELYEKIRETTTKALQSVKEIPDDLVKHKIKRLD